MAENVIITAEDTSMVLALMAVLKCESRGENSVKDYCSKVLEKLSGLGDREFFEVCSDYVTVFEDRKALWSDNEVSEFADIYKEQLLSIKRMIFERRQWKMLGPVKGTT